MKQRGDMDAGVPIVRSVSTSDAERGKALTNRPPNIDLRPALVLLQQLLRLLLPHCSLDDSNRSRLIMIEMRNRARSVTCLHRAELVARGLLRSSLLSQAEGYEDDLTSASGHFLDVRLAFFEVGVSDEGFAFWRVVGSKELLCGDDGRHGDELVAFVDKSWLDRWWGD